MSRCKQWHDCHNAPEMKNSGNMIRLSAMEHKLVTLKARGLDDAGIAATIGVSRAAMKGLIGSIIKKLADKT